ncbi:MAG TPA: hypothetical protein VG797_07520 [Phycisphaerales bacterium]|nr:hypothetical protein [Phycisphaerales bacterium]
MITMVMGDGVRLGNKLYARAAVHAWCIEEREKHYSLKAASRGTRDRPRGALTFIDPGFHPYAQHYVGLRGNLLASPDHSLGVGEFVMDRCRAGRLFWWLTRGAGRFGLLGGKLSPGRGEPMPRMLPPSGEWPVAGTHSARSAGPPRTRWVMMRFGIANPVGLMKHRGEVLRGLQPLPEIVEDARRFAAEQPADRIVIGVHVRHTDYRERLGGHLFVPLERTVEAMGELRAALMRGTSLSSAAEGNRDENRRVGPEKDRSPHPGPLPEGEGAKPAEPRFVIFSDEKRSASEFPGFDVEISRGNGMQDLYRMSTLPLVIGPLSSFSLWAAYHGGGLAWHLTGRPEGMELYGWFLKGMPATTRAENAARWVNRLREMNLIGAMPDRWGGNDARYRGALDGIAEPL